MRVSLKFIASVFFVSMLASLAAGAALAATEGKTAQGEPYVSGGVALGEKEALKERRPDFSLWVVTAAKKSGSFLADARVKITDEAGKTVLDTKLDGPWLLVNLKVGKYKVDASFGKQTLEKTTNIQKGDHHEMLFYFDVEVETLPKGEKG